MNETYLATARLLTDVAPVVFESGLFALKGGTAINLFLREMPRLSRAFVVYLASHNRTIHEVLFSVAKDIRLAYEGSFAGMTTEPVALETLLETRQRMFRELPRALDTSERQFLRSLVRAEPDWRLLAISHLEELPAIRWRLQNLQQLSRNDSGRFRALADSLDAGFAELDR